MTDTISRKAAIEAVKAIPAGGRTGECIRALRAIPSVDGWMDIESAPMDGTNIIGICMSAQNPKPSQTWFQGNWDHYSRSDGKWHGGIGVWFPTHWQPMPSPPNP